MCSETHGLSVSKLEQVWYYTSYKKELFEPIIQAMKNERTNDEVLLKKLWTAHQDEIVEQYNSKDALRKLEGKSSKEIEARAGFLENLASLAYA